MKALIFSRYGSIDHLAIVDRPKPTPSDDQILVRIHAASINDWDWGNLNGGFNRLFGGILRPKIVLGCDMAGEVEAVGKRVSKFKPGDRVYGDLCRHGFGAFQQYVCVPEAAVRPMSPRMAYEQAAAIPQAAVLAQQALFDSRPLSAGQRVLINGAGGGVGTLGIQLAKRYGVEVTAVDSGIKLDMLRSLGFDRVIDYEKDDFTAMGQRYDLIVDVKTNRPMAHYLRALAPGGIYATVGGGAELIKIALFGRVYGRRENKILKLIGLKPNRDLDLFSDLFEEGKLVPVIDGPYPFTEHDVREAFRHYGAGKQLGKVIINGIA